LKEFLFAFDFKSMSKLFQTLEMAKQGADSRKRFLQNGTFKVLLQTALV